MDPLLRYSKHYTHPLEKSEIVRVAKDSCKSMEFQRVKVITHSGPLSPGGASKCYYKNLEVFPNQVQGSLVKPSLLAFTGKKSIHLPGWQINDQRTTLQCPLDVPTLDKAAVLPIAAATRVTDLRQYINSNLAYSGLKFFVLCTNQQPVSAAITRGWIQRPGGR